MPQSKSERGRLEVAARLDTFAETEVRTEVIWARESCTLASEVRIEMTSLSKRASLLSVSEVVVWTLVLVVFGVAPILDGLLDLLLNVLRVHLCIRVG